MFTNLNPTILDVSLIFSVNIGYVF